MGLVHGLERDREPASHRAGGADARNLKRAVRSLRDVLVSFGYTSLKHDYETTLASRQGPILIFDTFALYGLGPNEATMEPMTSALWLRSGEQH